MADDHSLFRNGLKLLLADSDLIFTGEASSGQEVLDQVSKSDFDLLILEISMPGRNGIEILRELREIKPKLKVLILSMYPEDHYAVRAFKAGASGYLTKNTSSEELKKAIKTIMFGKKYINPHVAEQLANELDEGRQFVPHQKLSNREYQVLTMIASGKTVKEIANELFLSVSTVSTIRGRLLEKMGMKNNAELTYYAVKEELVG